MNVFELRQTLISKYQDYVQSFIRIRDQEIEKLVKDELKEGLLWPWPLVQLNPFFERGKSIPELVDERILSPECNRIFRVGKTSKGEGSVLSLHRHQEEAIRVANSRDTAAPENNYVLTTGTGSGKSLSYMIPIVDYCLRVGPRDKRTKAIIIYPMNTLANSQMGELEKFLVAGYPEGKHPVSFARYTGQEKDEDRDKIQDDPPDILLTNYVMMELILTRNEEHKIIRAGQNLRFLVLDELHTYRGRQGADVGMLVRRIREDLNARSVQHIGTSATLAGADMSLGGGLASAVFGPVHAVGHQFQGSAVNDVNGHLEAKGRPASFAPGKARRLFLEMLKDPPEQFLGQPLALAAHNDRISPQALGNIPIEVCPKQFLLLLVPGLALWLPARNAKLFSSGRNGQKGPAEELRQFFVRFFPQQALLFARPRFVVGARRVTQTPF